MATAELTAPETEVVDTLPEPQEPNESQEELTPDAEHGWKRARADGQTGPSKPRKQREKRVAMNIETIQVCVATMEDVRNALKEAHAGKASEAAEKLMQRLAKLVTDETKRQEDTKQAKLTKLATMLAGLSEEDRLAVLQGMAQ